MRRGFGAHGAGLARFARPFRLRPTSILLLWSLCRETKPRLFVLFVELLGDGGGSRLHARKSEHKAAARRGCAGSLPVAKYGTPGVKRTARTSAFTRCGGACPSWGPPWPPMPYWASLRCGASCTFILSLLRRHGRKKVGNSSVPRAHRQEVLVVTCRNAV